MWLLLDLRAKLDLKSTKLVFAPNYPNLSTVPPPFFFVPWNVLTFCIPPRFIFFCLSRIVVSTRVPFYELEIFRDFFSAKKLFWVRVTERQVKTFFFCWKKWVLFDQKVKNLWPKIWKEKKSFEMWLPEKLCESWFWVILFWEYLKSKTSKLKHSWTY